MSKSGLFNMAMLHGKTRIKHACVLLCALLCCMSVPQVYAADTLNTQVGKDVIYLQWQSAAKPGQSMVLYRTKAGGKANKLAEIVALTDPAKANAVMQKSPDSLSRGLTIARDFTQKILERPELDRALIMSSSGYAQVRGVAYIDRDISSNTDYHYRLMVRSADGSETVLADTDVNSGRLTVVAQPQVRGDIADERPRISISGALLVRYQVERADLASGPWQRATLIPLSATRTGETLVFNDSGATPDGRTLYYRVQPANVFDVPGEVSKVIVIKTPDLTAPQPPRVDQVGSEPAAATLSWLAATEKDIAGYHVYRRQILNGTDKNGLPATSAEKRLTASLLEPNITTYRDTDVIAGQIYQYELTATDTSGNESTHTPPMLARPRDTIPPATPRGLQAKADNQGKVTLIWQANSDADLYAYKVYRAVDDNDMIYVHELNAKDATKDERVTQVEILDVHSEAEYRYAVSALDVTENESAKSASVKVSLPDQVAPVAPVIAAVNAVDNALEIRWQPTPSPDVAGYHLYRGESSDILKRITTNPLNTNTLIYRDSSAAVGKVWFYAVCAVDRNGNVSEMSEPRSGTNYSKVQPQTPKSLAANEIGREWRLSWQAVPTVSGYITLISDARDGDYKQYGVLLTAAETTIPAPVRQVRWYRVQSVYANGAVSPLSEPLAVSLPPEVKR